MNRRVPLAMLTPGERGVLLDRGAGRRVNARLASMGLAPGKAVTMVSNHRGGPVIVGVDGARLALGRGMAGKIMVQLNPDGG